MPDQAQRAGALGANRGAWSAQIDGAGRVHVRRGRRRCRAGPDRADRRRAWTIKVAERIDTHPASGDEAIDRRLSGILETTGWYPDIAIQVRNGVVFLDGQGQDGEAGSGQGNGGKDRRRGGGGQSHRDDPGLGWNLAPVFSEIRSLWTHALQRLPRLALGVLVLALAVLAAWMTATTTSQALDGRLKPCCAMSPRAC